MLIFELATLFYKYVFMIAWELPQTFCIFAAAFELFGYINEPITNKIFKKINKQVSYAVMEDKIPLDALKRLVMQNGD